MTLLELLMALAMFTILLGIVGSVTLFLLRTETRQLQQTEQNRIVRTWKQMINDDFRSAIQDTEQLNKAEGSETIRHFGVNGTATQLRIDTSNYARRFAESSELRTIFYDFHATSGLVRREQDYAAPMSAGGIVQNAPEIVSGRFRYFDGATWHDNWTSLDRKGTPSLIEVTFYSLPLVEAERWRNRTNTVEPMMNRDVVQVLAASQSHGETYSRAAPPKPPEEPPLMMPPVPIYSPLQPQPPPQSPFHSLFGDD
jgi:hypothetical protein